MWPARSAQQCRSPRLSVFLAQKPLRVSSGVPVLKTGKRYRFSGRLTCVINGRRRSAPKRTRIDILNTVGKQDDGEGRHDDPGQGRPHGHPRVQELAS